MKHQKHFKKMVPVFTTADKKIEKTEVNQIVVKITNLLVILFGVFCTLILIYSIENHDRLFNGIKQIIAFYFLPGVILLILIVSLQLSTNFRINLVLILGSTGFSLYTAEGIAFLHSRLFSKQPGIQRIAEAKASNKPFDTKSRLQKIDELRQQGVAAYPIIIPANFWDDRTLEELIINEKKILPLSSISKSVTVSCNETGEWLIFDTDEYGFHNPIGLHGIHDIDIIALGDSYVHGTCVASDKNAVSIIRKEYPKTLNLGMPGNGPLSELATFKEYAINLKPKIVLWFYYENDFGNLMFEKQNDILLEYLNEKDHSQNLLSLQPQIDQSLKYIINEKIQQHFLLEQAVGNRENTRFIDSGIAWFITLRHLRNIISFHRQPDFKIYGEILKIMRIRS
ncbi:MAG: hypothetical protein HQM12_15035 [SAR324 cluster bacterium]|nr:hypothetical protein [SAR324 cluster bacterium]